jgi:hypothetical protein
MTDFQQGNGRAHGRGAIGERVDQLGQDAQQLLSDAAGAVRDLNETLDLRGRVERNPYGMVAAAFGVGYVLGGGLFTPFTMRVLRLGVRLAALPFVKDELLHMVEGAVENARAAQAAGSAAGPNAGSSGQA